VESKTESIVVSLPDYVVSKLQSLAADQKRPIEEIASLLLHCSVIGIGPRVGEQNGQ